MEEVVNTFPGGDDFVGVVDVRYVDGTVARMPLSSFF